MENHYITSWEKWMHLSSVFPYSCYSIASFYKQEKTQSARMWWKWLSRGKQMRRLSSESACHEKQRFIQKEMIRECTLSTVSTKWTSYSEMSLILGSHIGRWELFSFSYLFFRLSLTIYTRLGLKSEIHLPLTPMCSHVTTPRVFSRPMKAPKAGKHSCVGGSWESR